MTAASITVIFAINVALTYLFTGRVGKTNFGITFAAANITAKSRAWGPRRYFAYAIAPGILVAIFQYLWETSAAIAAVWFTGLAAETAAAIVLVS